MFQNFFQKKLLNFFYKDVFLDNDHIKNCSMKDITIMNSKSLNMDFKYQNYNFFQKIISKINMNLIINSMPIIVISFYCTMMKNGN